MTIDLRKRLDELKAEYDAVTKQLREAERAPKPRNLLQDTLQALKGRAPLWVDNHQNSIGWDEFCALADAPYGPATLGIDGTAIVIEPLLRVVGDTWWLERGGYPGQYGHWIQRFTQTIEDSDTKTCHYYPPKVRPPAAFDSLPICRVKVLERRLITQSLRHDDTEDEDDGD